MADKIERKNDPYATLFRKILKLTWNVTWGLTKATTLTIFDIAKWTISKTPEARAIMLLAAKKLQRIPPETLKEVLVRESDADGNVVQVRLYTDKQSMTANLGNDFFMERDSSIVIPDNILETFELSYTERDLDELRKEIANGDLRRFADLSMLEGVKEAEKGMLVEEAFKHHNNIPLFSELSQENLLMYDLFMTNQEQQKLISGINEKAEQGEFSMQQMLDCIEGRAGIEINEFAKILNNHSEKFADFLQSRQAAILLDAISHYPDINRMGGMNVDNIASLDIKQIQPVNELVLRLISATDNIPGLAEKASFVLKRIQTEREWETKDRAVFEKSSDENICANLIAKYSNAGCDKVVRAMMATVYMKTLDERNISQWGKFSGIVEAFNSTNATQVAMQQLEEGKLVKEQYNLPLYYGIAQQVSEIRSSLSNYENRYSGDLFVESEKLRGLQDELQKYTEVLSNFSHSFEIQRLDVEKIKMIQTAFGSGAALNREGKLKPEVEKAIRWLVERHSSNLGVISTFEETLDAAVLKPLCKIKENEYNFLDTDNANDLMMSENELPSEQEQQHEIDTSINAEEQEKQSQKPHLQDIIQIDNTVSRENSFTYQYASTIGEFGMDKLIESPDYVTLLASDCIMRYPAMAGLELGSYENAKELGILSPTIEISDPELQKQIMICSVGASLEYAAKIITPDDLLLSCGYTSTEISGVPLKQKEVLADTIAEYFANLCQQDMSIIAGKDNNYGRLENDDVPFPDDVKTKNRGNENVINSNKKESYSYKR